MMLIARKLLHGATFVRDSIQLIINNPVVLIYSVATFIINVAISFVTFPYFRELIQGNASSGMEFFLLRLVPALMTGVSIFFLACIAHHGMHLLQGELTSIQETLRGVVRRLLQIIVWLLIVLTYQYLVIKFGFKLLQCQDLVCINSLLYRSLIGVVTISSSLVLPIIATENTNVVVALQRVIVLVWRYFAVFLGAFIALFLINVVENSIVGLFTSYQAIAEYLLNILISPLSILTYTIFYFQYYARPRPELADIQQWLDTCGGR